MQGHEPKSANLDSELKRLHRRSVALDSVFSGVARSCEPGGALFGCSICSIAVSSPSSIASAAPDQLSAWCLPRILGNLAILTTHASSSVGPGGWEIFHTARHFDPRQYRPKEGASEAESSRE
jgi:hypothetical protein